MGDGDSKSYSSIEASKPYDDKVIEKLNVLGMFKSVWELPLQEAEGTERKKKTNRWQINWRSRQT